MSLMKGNLRINGRIILLPYILRTLLTVSRVYNSLQTLNQTSVHDDSSITSEEVDSAIRLAHKDKTYGEDWICHEHVMFGGTHLYQILSKLFSAMTKFSYVSIEMKMGVIITLYKGGRTIPMFIGL